MDKLDQALASMLNNEKSLANSVITFNQLQNEMTQGINKSSDWLYKKDVQMNNIKNEFDFIKKSDFDMIKKEIR